jgi:hypothetical protein
MRISKIHYVEPKTVVIRWKAFVTMQSDTIRFWIGWTLSMVAGYAIGVLLLLPWVVNLAYAQQPPVVIGLVGGAVLGGAIGGAQWLLLRRRTPIHFSWVTVSMAGSILGLVLGLSATESPDVPAFRAAVRDTSSLIIPWRVAWNAALAGALFGLGLGGAQWAVLRSYVTSSPLWWVVANCTGWMIGLGVGAAMAEIITVLGALLLTGLIAAAITGFTMEQWQWEMRKLKNAIPGRY